jgi:hypothetical protein
MHKAGVVHLNCWQLVICDLHACVLVQDDHVHGRRGTCRHTPQAYHMKTPETRTSLDAMMSEGMLLADISNQHLVLKAEHASKVSQG